MANEIHTEGLQYLLEVALSEEQSVPANFYIGLCTDAELAENASLGDQSELSGNNYSRQPVASSNADWTSAAAGTADRKMTSKTILFSASGGAWSNAKTAFLATTVDDSGKLLASAAVNGGSGYALADGENYELELEITLTG